MPTLQQQKGERPVFLVSSKGINSILYNFVQQETILSLPLFKHTLTHWIKIQAESQQDKTYSTELSENSKQVTMRSRARIST